MKPLNHNPNVLGLVYVCMYVLLARDVSRVTKKRNVMSNVVLFIHIHSNVLYSSLP